jgi:hypothetical protein
LRCDSGISSCRKFQTAYAGNSHADSRAIFFVSWQSSHSANPGWSEPSPDLQTKDMESDRRWLSFQKCRVRSSDWNHISREDPFSTQIK